MTATNGHPTEIQVKKLSVTFGEGKNSFLALDEVSFDVLQGESFGLVGESGSGKTTVLRALAGIFDYGTHTDGIMQWGAEVLDGNRSKNFRRKVQMVFQDPYGSLHPRHTVVQILTEPAKVHGLNNIEGRVIKALEEVGLDASFRFRYPHQISGGQRQRISIARALITEPEVVLLDEPTSALDVSVQAEVLNLLVRLQEERKLTYVLVSHDLAVVSHMCKRLIVMQHGRVVETLNVDALRRAQPKNPYTKRLLLASKGYDKDIVENLEDFDD